MGVRRTLGNVGLNIVMVSGFALIFVAPAIVSIVDTILILLKLLGYIKWSWLAVIFGPMLIEVIPLVFGGIGLLLVMFEPSVQKERRPQ